MEPKKENVYQSMRVAKDEAYTTRAEADKLVDYLLTNNLIDKSAKIWMPFDTELSRIYLAFKDKGFSNLILSSLEHGQDFYYYEPEEWDVIISNPPFSGRTNLLHRLFSFNKPFIILQGTQFFNNQFAVNYLCEYDGQISFLLPRTRMRFMTYNEKKNVVQAVKSGAAFYSFWLLFKIVQGRAFLSLPDSGRENDDEIMDMEGNPIEDNYYNLFNWQDKIEK